MTSNAFDAHKNNEVGSPAQHGSAEPNLGAESEYSVPIVEVRYSTDVEGDIRAYKRREQRRDRWRVFLEFLTVVGILAYGAIAYRQWNAMAKAVEQQVLINRPMILADGIIPAQLVEGTPVIAFVDNVNFGKSIALKVFSVGRLKIQDSDKATPTDPECNPDHRPKDTTLALAPRGEVADPNSHAGGFRAQWYLVHPSDAARAKDRMMRLYAVGCAYYEGLDHSSYYSDICAMWTGSAFQPCEDPDRNYIR